MYNSLHGKVIKFKSGEEQPVPCVGRHGLARSCCIICAATGRKKSRISSSSGINWMNLINASMSVSSSWLCHKCHYNDNVQRLMYVMTMYTGDVHSLLRRSDHITDTLASFHWLKVPERVQYKLATIVYRSLNGMAPHYLAVDLRRLSDMPSRRRLRSSLTHQLDVRQSQCAAVGDRTFAVAGARLWNSLPPDIVVCDTLPQFRRELKHFSSDTSILI